MNETNQTASGMSALRSGAAMVALAVDCLEDPALHAKMVSDPSGMLAERGIHLPDDVDVRVVANSGDTFHVVLPPDPNSDLGDEALNSVAGGFNSLACAGTASSFGTLPSCISTGGTAGTASSA